MNSSSIARRFTLLGAALLMSTVFAGAAFAAGPEVVAGPAAEPEVLRALGAGYQVLQVPGQEGPVPHRARQRLHRQHLAHPDDQDRQGLCRRSPTSPPSSRNSRSSRPARTSPRRSPRSTTSSIPAMTRSSSTRRTRRPSRPVIKRAKEAGVVLVAFDNILDTEDAINVNVDQKGLGVLWANWLIKHIPNGGKILEVRGVAGTSVDTDRHNGIHETLDASGKKWDVVEVVGKWDDPTAQKVDRRRDRRQRQVRRHHRPGRRHRRRAGDDRRQASVRAVRRRDRERLPQVLRAKFAGDGLKCSSAGTGPAQVAVAIKTAIAALEGQVVPQSVKLPLAIVEDPDFKDGENYYPDQSDNFFVGNAFPTCGINFTAQEIMGQTEGEPVVYDQDSATARRRGAYPRRACRSGGGDGRRSATALPHGGRLQALWRRAGAGEGRAHRRGRPHPRHPRRERRRQIDADQDHGRRRRARRGPHDARGPRGHASPRPAAANQAGIVCIFQELSLIPDLIGRRQHRHQQSAAALRHDRPARRSGGSPRRRWRAPAPRTSIRWRWSRTCRCRAGRWSRSPRRWPASRAS